MGKYDGVEIRNGRVYGASYGRSHQTKLDNGDAPIISTTIDFDGIPIEQLLRRSFDAMIITGRKAMRKMDAETVKNVYGDKPVSWRVMVDAEAAAQHARNISMTADELDAEIERLMAMRENASE